MALQGLWKGNVPALLMVMPYTAIQFMVLQKLKTFVAGSSRGGLLLHQDSTEFNQSWRFSLHEVLIFPYLSRWIRL